MSFGNLITQIYPPEQGIRMFDLRVSVCPPVRRKGHAHCQRQFWFALEDEGIVGQVGGFRTHVLNLLLVAVAQDVIAQAILC